MNEREFYRVILGLQEPWEVQEVKVESFNASIQSLKATARRFRNFDRYRTRIIFFLGSLNLNPL